MKLHMTPDGFFTELSAVNRTGEIVYPHESSMQGSAETGLKITLTGKSKDYHIVSVEQFVRHIANGDFDRVGRVRMKPKQGGSSNGFAVRTATMSETLIEAIKAIRGL